MRLSLPSLVTTLRRIESSLPTIRRWADRPRVKRVLLAIAFAIFLVLAIVAFRNLPEGAELRPVYMVAIALMGPVGWCLNAAEYRSAAKAAGHRIPFDTALRVSLAVSLANLLPAPGGVAVKTAALKLEGSSIGSALTVNAIAGAIWIGATAVLVGLALLTDPAFVAPGAALAVLGAAILAGSALALRRRRPGWRRIFVELLAIETAATAYLAIGVALGFAALGESASIATATTIASAEVISVAIGIFPATLGLREALSGALAAAVTAPAAVGVAASIVVRASAYAGRVLYFPALALYFRHAARRRAAEESAPAARQGPEAQPASPLLGGSAPRSVTADSDQIDDSG